MEIVVLNNIYTSEFQAVAVTPGIFTLPPTKAFDVEFPEVMGLSAAGILPVSVCYDAHLFKIF